MKKKQHIDVLGETIMQDPEGWAEEEEQEGVDNG